MRYKITVMGDLLGRERQTTIFMTQTNFALWLFCKRHWFPEHNIYIYSSNAESLSQLGIRFSSSFQTTCKQSMLCYQVRFLINKQPNVATLTWTLYIILRGSTTGSLESKFLSAKQCWSSLCNYCELMVRVLPGFFSTNRVVVNRELSCHLTWTSAYIGSSYFSLPVVVWLC